MNSAYAWFDAILNIPHALLYFYCNTRMLDIKSKKLYIYPASLISMVIVYLNNVGYMSKVIRIVLTSLLFTFYVCFFVREKYRQSIVFVGLHYLLTMLCETLGFLICYVFLGEHINKAMLQPVISISIKETFICVFYIWQRLLCAFWRRFVRREKSNGVSIFVPVVILQGVLCGLVMIPYFNDSGNNQSAILCFLGAVISIVSDMAIFFYLNEIHKRDLEIAKEEYLKIQITNQQNRVDLLNQDIEKAAVIKNNIRAGLSDAKLFLGDKKADKAKTYLANVTEQLLKKYQYSDNRVVDAIVSDKAKVCEEKEIELHTKIDIPGQMVVKNAELCVIFANLLDNAIRACERYEEAPQIRLAARERGGYLVIRQENSFDGVVEDRKQGHLSEHGLGLGIVEQIAEKYEGRVQTEMEEGKFVTVVMVKV